ncbi:MAG: Glu-tRNA(Gln) amidotransferase subunit GatD [Candidatus Micrarchaeota archaeon]|nr:Glu-tRNA(Gln) amidotransferase subunit GatD [Candidatus Micrarchaeota archaeon]
MPPKKSKKGPTPEPGDEVLAICEGREFRGILLPPSLKDDSFITIKLDSGYNIGIQKGKITKIEVLKKGEARLTAKKEQSTTPAPSSPFTSFISCGGTIVNKIDYRTGAVHPAVSPRELIEGLPALSKYSIRARMLFSIASEDMSPWHWVRIAEAVAGEIKDGAYGVVLAHGTDTMHYTSAALSFMLQNLPCPVIFTGSQRSSDRGSSDAEANLLSSFLAANSDLSGVFVCMHENTDDETCLLHFGAKVRKMHTSRRDAFRSISSLPAARVWPFLEKIEKVSERCPARSPNSKLTVDTKLNTKVAMQYIYPGLRPEAFKQLFDYDGVVLVGFGLGHVPVNLSGEKNSYSLLLQIKELIASGIPVVLSSQAMYGRINLNVYTNQRVLREAGVIGHMCDMTPETAYVKLMWVLGREKKMGKIKELMEKNIAGEITERTEFSSY